jgi:AraC-like DNA-binding protein
MQKKGLAFLAKLISQCQQKNRWIAGGTLMGDAITIAATANVSTATPLKGKRARTLPGVVRSDIIRSFDEIAHDCGGNARQLLLSVGLGMESLQQTGDRPTLPYAKVVALLNEASRVLRRPDFGLHLASRQPPNGVGGPLSIAMRNCPTVGDAFRFCADRMYTYSDYADLIIRKDADSRRWILQFDTIDEDRVDQRQIIELSLLRTILIASFLSGGRARPRETWFKHQPMSSLTVYKSYFRSRLSFCASMNAVTFNFDDDRLPVTGHDREVYQLATSFIEQSWARPEEPLSLKIRRLLHKRSGIANVSTNDVASVLAMHPRTLQRRLREEGTCFEDIRDDLGRADALHYLKETNIPLVRVATLLGYSGLPAFSRRCRQWFSSTPGEVRHLSR